jgi:putative membrane protein
LAPVFYHWPAITAALFALIWLAAAWRPLFPQDWALENVLSLAAAWWLLRHHRRSRLSNLSYTLLLLFAMAHELGSHYTYSEVPYDRWAQALLGGTISEYFGTGRNHYDRLVHLLFGLLCYRPLREVVAPGVRPESGASYVFPLTLICTISLLYEMVEWAAAMAFGGDLGQAYLGTQGDIWDAQKDSALAATGGTLALLVCRLARRHGSSEL